MSRACACTCIPMNAHTRVQEYTCQVHAHACAWILLRAGTCRGIVTCFLDMAACNVHHITPHRMPHRDACLTCTCPMLVQSQWGEATSPSLVMGAKCISILTDSRFVKLQPRMHTYMYSQPHRVAPASYAKRVAAACECLDSRCTMRGFDWGGGTHGGRCHVCGNIRPFVQAFLYSLNRRTAAYIRCDGLHGPRRHGPWCSSTSSIDVPPARAPHRCTPEACDLGNAKCPHALHHRCRARHTAPALAIHRPPRLVLPSAPWCSTL